MVAETRETRGELRSLGSFGSRVSRSIGLQGPTFEEVARDRAATAQSVIVVLLASLATGMAVIPDDGFSGLPARLVIGLAGWLVWAASIRVIAKAPFFRTEREVEWGELARSTGFAHAPLLFRMLGVLSGAGALLALITLLWQAVAMAVAARNTYGYSDWWKPSILIAVSVVPFLAVTGAVGLVLLN